MRKFRTPEDALCWYVEWRTRLGSPSSSSAERLGIDRIVSGPTGGRGLDDIRALVADVSGCLDPGPRNPMGLERLTREELMVLLTDAAWDKPDRQVLRELSRMDTGRWTLSGLMNVRLRAWRKFEKNLEKAGLI